MPLGDRRRRDDLRDYVAGQFGDNDAVLIVDETGDLKKGALTVGMQRQYTGIAGRIENAQGVVYLTYAATRGHAMIDRELYLPKSWTEPSDRCERAGVPEDSAFATKPALATGMLTRRFGLASRPGRWPPPPRSTGRTRVAHGVQESGRSATCWRWTLFRARRLLSRPADR